MMKEKNLTGGIYLKQLFFLQKCSHMIKIYKEKLNGFLCDMMLKIGPRGLIFPFKVLPA